MVNSLVREERMSWGERLWWWPGQILWWKEEFGGESWEIIEREEKRGKMDNTSGDWEAEAGDGVYPVRGRGL